MAFFSDAMAHTAMAGVTLSLLLIVLAFSVKSTREADEYLWLLPVVMACVGIATGLLIAWLQDATGLGTDTVIGVFFALSLGFAGLLLPGLQASIRIDLESVLFGQLLLIDDIRLLILGSMAVLTLGVVLWKYNAFVLGSFHPSLARSRGLPVRFNNYLFVVLLALVVNLSIYAVGVLLINALLIVPAAAAVNVSRNIRRLFWFTLFGCIACAIVGYRISTTTQIQLGSRTIDPGPSGAVVMVCVGWFALSLVPKAFRRRATGAAPIAARLDDHEHHAGCGH